MPMPARMAPTKEASLGQSVCMLLTERLIAGQYRPCEKLSLRKVAAGLGVSMMPVREAVSRLVADGALEVTPNKAVRVPILDLKRFRELTALRIEIEGMAAGWAAAARDAADLNAISQAEQAFQAERAKVRPRLVITVALNQKFHFAVYRAAKSPMLVQIIIGLWLKAGPILNFDMARNDAWVSSRVGERCHAAALAAIQRQDGDAARAAIAADIQQTSDRIIALGQLPE